MRTIALCITALLGLPAVASAQPSVDIHIELPVVLPRLVVVSPGVQVVPEVHEEVFFHDGWYWVRRDAYWYRSRNHRGGWVLVPSRTVPRSLSGVPPGKYRNWKAEKEAEKAERKAAKRAQKDHGHDDHDDHGKHGKKHGKGHD